MSKKNDIDLSQITDPEVQKKIAQKLDAIERFVSLGCIALGLLQILAVKHHRLVWGKYGGWLRTVRWDIPSVEVVLSVIRDEYFFNSALSEKPNCIVQLPKNRAKSSSSMLRTWLEWLELMTHKIA